ncbi:MAG: Re/Si-specific NAD(P)(+) transhydrogenase subunit alpha [Myxococcota bacterium]
MIVAVPKETAPGERRVALVPEAVKSLAGDSVQVVVEAGCGADAGFDDASYEAAGAAVESGAASLLGRADLVLKVQPPSEAEIGLIKGGAILVAFLKPLDQPDTASRLAAAQITAFSMELMPRISRAQSMDALSSQSNIAGYRAVLLAAAALPKIFPMMVTAAGTIQPARVLVVGAGVAGLQAIATAKRLGAVVEAYDTRAAVKEQIESLGARFIELDIDTGDSEDSGGYAVAQTEAFYERQREQLGKRVAACDVVITTALVPGQPAPFLIDEAAVQAMQAGSVIVDLAAEKGGNCPLTTADETTTVHGVTLIGSTNLPSEVPANASQMYARNLTTFVKHLAPEGEPVLDFEDEITGGAVLTHGGKIANEMVRSRVEGGNN